MDIQETTLPTTRTFTLKITDEEMDKLTADIRTLERHDNDKLKEIPTIYRLVIGILNGR
jgi:hypothetical protein